MSARGTSNPLAELRHAGWIVIAAGAMSVVAGLLAIAYPDLTLITLAIFAGVNLIIAGVMGLVEALVSDDDKDGGGSKTLTGVLGVLGLIAGLVILRRPGETLLALVLVLGVWLVISGTVQFLRAFENVENRALQLLVAVGEITLGALILSVPDLSLRTLAIFAGIGFILRGALAIYGGWQLRKGNPVAAGSTQIV